MAKCFKSSASLKAYREPQRDKVMDCTDHCSLTIWEDRGTESIGEFEQECVPREISKSLHLLTPKRPLQEISNNRSVDRKSSRRKLRDIPDSDSVMQSLSGPEWTSYMNCPISSLIDTAPFLSQPKQSPDNQASSSASRLVFDPLSDDKPFVRPDPESLQEPPTPLQLACVASTISDLPREVILRYQCPTVSQLMEHD